jgi:hypothetical protein
MQYTIWLKKKTAIFIGGDPAKGMAPVVTIDAREVQILVDPDKGTITIIET